jgi:hypothetical protein
VLSALYYPHTHIRNENLLKNALLLWDEVEYISPYKNFDFHAIQDRTFLQAMEIICVPHVPTRNEQNIVHSRLNEVLAAGVPDWMVQKEIPQSLRQQMYPRSFGLYPRTFSRDQEGDFGIYMQKFAHETWKMLEEAELVRFKGSDSDYYTRPTVGLFLMSLLADACAGTVKSKITDQAEAYSFLWKMAALEAGANYGPAKEVLRGQAADRLVTLSIKAIGAKGIPLKNLIAMRVREGKSRGHDYRAFRRRYANELDNYVNRLCTEAKTESDWKEIERQFRINLKDDLASLRDELRLAKRQLLFSNEIGVAALAAGSLFLEPVTASIWLGHLVNGIGWGALVKNVTKFGGAYQ